MSTDSSIASWLIRPGEPVYATSLTPADFHPLDTEGESGWTVRGRTSAGVDARYVIRLSEDASGAFCDMSDEGEGAGPRPMQDPFRRTFGEAASVQDWYDAICMADAAAELAQRSAKDWGSDDLGTVLARVEHGISAYGQHEVATSNLGSVTQLQEWIDDALAATQVQAVAFELSDYPYERGVSREGQMLQSVVDDKVVGYVAEAVATNMASDNWLTSARTAPKPRVELHMSGPERISLRAEAVQSWSSVDREGTLRRDGVTPARGGWVLLGVVGTDVAVPLPWGSANLRIDTDDDGATVVIRVLASDQREVFHRNRAAFERRWGRWLDDDVVLTDDELRDGIVRAEEALRTAIAKETN